jgi:hypothetical protein
MMVIYYCLLGYVTDKNSCKRNNGMGWEKDQGHKNRTKKNMYVNTPTSNLAAG